MKIRAWIVVVTACSALCAVAHAEVKYAAEGARDPFFEEDALPAPDPSAPQATETWQLDGFLWSPTLSIAVINGKKFKAGDKINRAEVVSIDKRAVHLKRDGKDGYLTKQGIQWK